jgi:ketosteroid isomerase-like protein
MDRTMTTTTTTESNRWLVEAIFAGLAQSDSRPFVDAMAEDFRWTVTGSTKWSRTYAGKQAVLGELFAPLRKRIRDRVRTHAQRFIADGEYVVVEARGENTTTAGRPYNNRYCFVFRVAGGKLKEVTEYLDTELVTSALGDPALDA